MMSHTLIKNDDNRDRLPPGTKLDGVYSIVENLSEYDSDTFLCYKAESGDFLHEYYIITELYPLTGCVRNADNSLSIDEALMNKAQFDKTRALFFKNYLEISRPAGDPQLGRAVDYKMLNGTAYCFFEYSAYDFLQKIQAVSSYAKLPPEYLPSYQGAAELDYEVTDNALTIKGIDFNNDVYSYTLQSAVAALVGRIREQVSSDREALYEMLTRLEEFESDDSDYSMGERRSSLTIEEMDKDLGLGDHEWRLLRLLIKHDDEFYSWVISGECSGVAMTRNGRTFKSWVRTIS